MPHIWSSTHTVTEFYCVDVADDEGRMNDEYRAFKWITEFVDELPSYPKEIIKQAEIN